MADNISAGFQRPRSWHRVCSYRCSDSRRSVAPADPGSKHHKENVMLSRIITVVVLGVFMFTIVGCEAHGHVDTDHHDASGHVDVH
jgi:hypothetical protein